MLILTLQSIYHWQQDENRNKDRPVLPLHPGTTMQTTTSLAGKVDPAAGVSDIASKPHSRCAVPHHSSHTFLSSLCKETSNSHHSKYRYMPLITTNTGTSSHHNKYGYMPLITSTGTCLTSQQIQVHASHHSRCRYMSHITTNTGIYIYITSKQIQVHASRHIHNKCRYVSHITTNTGQVWTCLTSQ